LDFYKHKIFPWLLDVNQPKELAEQRRLALRDVMGEILEIGIGTGANLPYYPENIKALTAIGPSAALHPRARRRALASGRKVEWYQGGGEHLPFKEGRFDTVVTVDVLCSVDNVDMVLGEAYRVIKPGGRFHFLEHGIAQDEKIRKWQIRLNGWNKITGGGCELTRDIEKHIQNSSFLMEELVHVAPFSGTKVVYTHIRGVAVKPASVLYGG
jgi:ubiquinone/menaquinone biosynthesis C-methylase UbiE